MKRNLLHILIIFIGLIIPAMSTATTLHFKISGITGAAAENVEARLTALQLTLGDPLTADDITHFYQQAPENIKKALEPYGYFKVQISAQKLTQQGENWTAAFVITPGPALKISQTDIQITGPGKNDPVIQNFVAHFPLHSGQFFDSAAYDKAKETLFQTVNNQGYIKAVLSKKEVRINLQTYTAEIILHLDTGPRYYFGTVTFNQTELSPAFLQRFISFQPDEPFSSAKLLKLQQAMSNSRYFQQVVITPEIVKAENSHIPVNVFVTLPKSQQYTIGAGYGTFTGPRVTLGTDIRRITPSGQHLTAQVKWSPVLKGVGAKYFIPGKNPLTDEYTLGVSAQKFIPQNGASFSENFSGSYVKNIHDWQNTTSLNYLIERYQVESNPSEVSRFLYPSYTLSRIKADNLSKTLFGSSTSLTLQGANEHVLASTSFAQGLIKEKYIFSPTFSSRIILRGDLGYTVVTDQPRLPLTLNFFAGGINSVRGYGFSSLGPGRYLEVGSIEYQHKIVGNWNAAVFYDAGNAENHFNNVLFRGDGFGVVYDSFIGALQVYLARAENKPGKPLSVELSVGPDF